MLKNKHAGELNQLHCYCNPNIYDGFKASINKINKNNNANYSISEIIRAFMITFCKSAEFRTLIINNVNINRNKIFSEKRDLYVKN